MRIETAGLICALALASASSRAEGTPLEHRAANMLAAMEGDAHRVAGLLRNARAAHAAGPTKCVDRYLSQIDTDVRHGREDVADLHAALAARNGARAGHAMSRLTGRREAARWASFAADTCLTPQMATDRDHTTVRVILPRLPSDRAVFSR
jgi:hypothetical protein